MAAHLVPWRTAWETALYGADGFFRRSRPAEHFRTSVHVDGFARAVAELATRTGARTVVDLGAGAGELVTALRRIDPDLDLVAVEVSARPAELPDDIAWLQELPVVVEGLVVANEWLDNLPCDVVEVDPHGVVRDVLVDPTTGEESLGDIRTSSWLDRWWPVTTPGRRAEVGEDRDAAWAEVVSRVHGTAVAIDYGHRRDDRPPFGSLRSYADGREVGVVPDGSRDVTAHVAVDSVASMASGNLLRQRDALLALGVSGDRPPIDLARSDPAAYVRALGRAGEAGELLARGGLGDFWWIVTDTTGRGTGHGTLWA